MSNLPKESSSQIVNLKAYINKIPAKEDRTLFKDAVHSAEAGALRAAYLMIWLACAESLKRRFYEAKKRDSSAEKIVTKIENKEQAQQAVDKYILKISREYGFISDSGHDDLSYIYKMRCLYAHPYEEAPSQELVLHAADAVIRHVLSKPVKLKKAYVKQLLKDLMEDSNYLDDERTEVQTFANNILPRIDENIYKWLLDEYWKELEKIADDKSMTIFLRRGRWFCYAVLKKTGMKIFSNDEWHDRTRKFPKALIQVCRFANIYKGIGRRAQNSLVGTILSESETRPRILKRLEWLSKKEALNERQQERFVKHISKMKPKEIISSGLSTKTYYEHLISQMKARNWSVQSPAIDFIVSNGLDQIAELDKNQQINLGRNVLQVAEGGEWSASIFLDNLSRSSASLPIDFVHGIALEVFANEQSQVRFKIHCLSKVLSILDRLTQEQQDQLISEIVSTIEAGNLKNPNKLMHRHHYDDVINLLKFRKWAEPLMTTLERKEKILVAN